jgi:hypothetical protein
MRCKDVFEKSRQVAVGHGPHLLDLDGLVDLDDLASYKAVLSTFLTAALSQGILV